MKATMKKVLSMVLVVALVASASIMGTMAYLTTEAGNEKNVFTVGNIDVSLDEEVGVYGEGGEVKENENGADYTDIMPGDYLKKEVTVTNNGKTDAYVAVTVTLNNALEINKAIDQHYEALEYTADQIQAIYANIFDGWGINYNPRPGAYEVNDARGVIDGTYGLPEHVLHVDFAKTTNGSTVIGANNWFIAGGEKAGQYWVDGPAEYDGYYTSNMEDYQICYTYYIYLPAGETTTLFNGLNVPAEFDADQLAMFDGLVIDVEAKAIQADNMGIADQYIGDENGEAKTAFAILAGDIESEDIPEITYASTGDDLVAALAGDGYVVLGDSIDMVAESSSGYGKTGVVVEAGDVLDGNGETLTVSGANTTWDSAVAGKGGTIKNLTISGAMRGIFMPGANGDLYIDNVVFDDVVYTFNSDAGSEEYGVYISNSTLNGWTSYSNVHKEVVFTNCEFGEGSDYAFLRAYNDTEFKNCHFSADDGFELQVMSSAVVTLENCYYGDTLITAENIAELGLLYSTDNSHVSVK